MKKCPKCGALNQPDRSTCLSCETSLEDVAPAWGSAQASAGADQPEVPGQPGAAHGPYSVRGAYPRPAPVGRSAAGRTAALLLLVLVLVGGGFAVWRYLLQPRGPMAVARAFMTTVAADDMEASKKYLSKDSLKMLEALSGLSAYIKPSSLIGVPASARSLAGQPFEENKQYVLSTVKVDANSAQINVKPGPTPAAAFDQASLGTRLRDGVPIVLVKEPDDWKVDLGASAQARLRLGGG